MEIRLYDHRLEEGDNFSRSLGKTDDWKITWDGTIHIRRTDYLYSLAITLNKKEVEKLHARLDQFEASRKEKLAGKGEGEQANGS